MKEVTCPSGAVLKITMSPFGTAKALYQAVLKEARGVDFSSKTELPTVLKDLFCVAFSSIEIEKHLKECFRRCTYNDGRGDLRIDDSTFESATAREDYFNVCMEVAQENIYPFVKSLYAEFQRITATIPTTPA